MSKCTKLVSVFNFLFNSLVKINLKFVQLNIMQASTFLIKIISYCLFV